MDCFARQIASRRDGADRPDRLDRHVRRRGAAPPRIRPDGRVRRHAAPSRQHFLARPARADRRPHEGDHPRAASRGDRSGARGMTTAIPSIALVGNPNAGKSSLFNALTGARQKIANYPGVTVERKAGHASFADGRPLSLIDLPGTYSLRSEEHTSELQSLMRISYAVFCLKKKKITNN